MPAQAWEWSRCRLVSTAMVLCSTGPESRRRRWIWFDSRVCSKGKSFSGIIGLIYFSKQLSLANLGTYYGSTQQTEGASASTYGKVHRVNDTLLVIACEVDNSSVREVKCLFPGAPSSNSGDAPMIQQQFGSKGRRGEKKKWLVQYG